MHVYSELILHSEYSELQHQDKFQLFAVFWVLKIVDFDQFNHKILEEVCHQTYLMDQFKCQVV